MKNTKITFLASLIAFSLVACNASAVDGQSSDGNSDNNVPQQNITIKQYADNAGKLYEVVYSTSGAKPTVVVKSLNDASVNYALTQTTAWAKGAEYANSDNSVTFMFQRNNAELVVNGKKTKMQVTQFNNAQSGDSANTVAEDPNNIHHKHYVDSAGKGYAITFNTNGEKPTVTVKTEGKNAINYTLTQTVAWAKGGEYANKDNSVTFMFQRDTAEIVINGKKTNLTTAKTAPKATQKATKSSEKTNAQTAKTTKTTTPDPRYINTVRYVDNAGKSYNATYDTSGKKPIVTLKAQGKTYTLTQTVAWAKGAEYANKDNSVTFMFQRDTAELVINGKKTKLREAK